MCACSTSRARATTHGASVPSRRTASRIVGCACWCANRTSEVEEALRQPAGAPRAAETGRARQPEADRAADAGRGTGGAQAPSLQVHDDERSRPARGGESARPRVRGRGAQSALGRRHDRAVHRRRAGRSCTSRRFSICSRASSSAGRERGQRPAPVLKALDMAVRRRCPDAGLLHHSDQGSTYASEDYQTSCEAHGITCSMSRRGNCYDNAAMESWFSTLKNELARTSRATASPRPSCSTTSRSSTTSSDGTRRWRILPQPIMNGVLEWRFWQRKIRLRNWIKPTSESLLGALGVRRVPFDAEAGRPLELALDATYDDFVEQVNESGRFRLEPVDGTGRVIPGCVAVTEVVLDDEDGDASIPPKCGGCVAASTPPDRAARRRPNTQVMKATASAFGSVQPQTDAHRVRRRRDRGGSGQRSAAAGYAQRDSGRWSTRSSERSQHIGTR